MARHEFGIMQEPPKKGVRYDEYEPQKYNCISVNDDYLEDTDADVLVFDSGFYKKKVTLDANSDGAICLRISDTNGRILLDEKTIQPGTDLELDMLENDVEYIVEIKGNADFLFWRTELSLLSLTIMKLPQRTVLLTVPIVKVSPVIFSIRKMMLLSGMIQSRSPFQIASLLQERLLTM